MEKDNRKAEMVERVDPTIVPISTGFDEVEHRHVSFRLIILTAVSPPQTGKV